MEISKTALIAAVENTYDNSHFQVGVSTNSGDSFFNGICTFSTKWLLKSQLLNFIGETERCSFPMMKNHEENVVLSDHLYVWSRDVVTEQRYELNASVDKFTHVVSKTSPHYDVYFRLDNRKKEIVFACGNRIRAFPVEEHSSWCWRPFKGKLYCDTMKQLEDGFLSLEWNPMAVKVGRSMLGFPETLSQLLRMTVIKEKK